MYNKRKTNGGKMTIQSRKPLIISLYATKQKIKPDVTNFFKVRHLDVTIILLFSLLFQLFQSERGQGKQGEDYLCQP